MLLARGCNQHYVAVCPQVLGRHLYTALKDAAIGAGGALRDVGWNVPMRTRMALGFAGGYWGGRSVAQAEGYAMTAGDFPAATTQELDEFMVPSGDTPEAKPRPPATWDDWLRRVRRAVNLWALVYGEEWRPVMTQCATKLEQMHDDHPTTFPREVIKDIWEELCWRFWEELRETLRALRQAVGRDNLRKADLITYALTPGADGQAWLQLPKVFDLTDGEAWFRKAILPRIERRHERTLWDLTWRTKPGAAPPKAGETADRHVRAAAGPAKGAGRERRTYPAGKLLEPLETQAANDHKPLDADGRAYCWGWMTHQGCHTTSTKGCGRSHNPMRSKLGDLHWTVQAQILRRGGLKSGAAVPVKDVDERVNVLRAAAARADGAATAADRRGGQLMVLARSRTRPRGACERP